MTEREAIRVFEKVIPYDSEFANARTVAIRVLERSASDGCSKCRWEDRYEWEMPCKKCMRNCKDYWMSKEEDDDERTD